MRYAPRHLPNKLEYKVLSCISVHYQSRMTSNEIAITPSRLHSAGRAMVLFTIHAGCHKTSECVGGEFPWLLPDLGMLWVLLFGDLRCIR